MWSFLSEVLEINCGRDFESIARMRLSKKYVVVNIFTSVALWGLWKLRSYLCFRMVFGEMSRRYC
ncbi:hypothetical protein HU200_019320 [Digitaria exilis]|uniref:Transmembrane protein n=1 Tax=Digitaria exilis TaxID=1010633 RepID=A0A835KHZ4_9POAL|nr:hypothetical protein HU200_019320 [Digitaria exilis]